MDNDCAHYKTLNSAQINSHENQNSGYEYLSVMILLMKNYCIKDS